MIEDHHLLEVPDPARELTTARTVDALPAHVFTAWTVAEHLARWWGPNGFSNTFHSFDPQPGGHWVFTQHGPNGANFENECVFVEVGPGRIVLDHVSPPVFRITATFEARDGHTEVTFSGRFRTVEECDRVRRFAAPANEENLDRLEAELARMG